MSTAQNSTIFALATPPARSGVAIIRISGPQALSCLEQLSGKQGWQPNMARHARFFAPAPSSDPSSTLIDSGLGLFFKAPKSFTGEDVAELHVHGSMAIIRELLDLLTKLPGMRPAEPGEFSRRAFLNGKMDLIEAEGLADLIEAETKAQKRQALEQMTGGISRFYEDLRTKIIRSLALLEAYIDFPEEDIPQAVLAETQENIHSIQLLIKSALEQRQGEKIREGLSIAILGAPNVGKSSLINRLAGREAAIVSHHAGTTRDIIEIQMDIAGLPVRLWDTAGLRESQDDIEQEGIRRALARAGEADIKLVMFEAGREKDPESAALICNNSLIINNKIDIFPRAAIAPGEYAISTRTGEGIDLLLEALSHVIRQRFSSESAALITRSRHRALLSQALAHLDRYDSAMPLELACEELRQAALSIGKITGKIMVDDVLDVIFKQFCIGK